MLCQQAADELDNALTTNPGFDAAAHISEETQKARFAIPRAMFWSICMNGSLAFGMVIVLLYCFGDVATNMLASYPLGLICLGATQSIAGASVCQDFAASKKLTTRVHLCSLEQTRSEYC